MIEQPFQPSLSSVTKCNGWCQIVGGGGEVLRMLTDQSYLHYKGVSNVQKKCQIHFNGP